MVSGQLMVLMVVHILLSIKTVLVGGAGVKGFTTESNVDILKI